LVFDDGVENETRAFFGFSSNFFCCQPYDSQTSQEFLEELREDEINVFILFCLEMFL